MDHAAAQNLEPVLVAADLQLTVLEAAADVELGRGFGKREIAGPEAHLDLVDLKKGAHEILETALKVPHMRFLVDHQPFELMEHRRMGGIRIRAVGAARGDDPDRRLLALHGPDLYRRRVGPQKLALTGLVGRQIEGIVHLPGRMFGRDIEGGEIMEIVFDIAALGDGKTQISENFRYFVTHL